MHATYHGLGTGDFGAVVGGSFEPTLDPQRMDRRIDAELSQSIFCDQVQQHAAIYLLAFDRRDVDVKLLRREERAQLLDRPLIHRRLRRRRRRRLLRPDKDCRRGRLRETNLGRSINRRYRHASSSSRVSIVVRPVRAHAHSTLPA